MAAGGPALALLDGLRWRGAPVPGGRSHALLAALVREPGRTVGDERLVEEVWGPDAVPAAPTKALQVLVSRTRAGTGPDVVVRSGHGYRLGVDDVDVLLLRAHARAARAALTRRDLGAARDEARAALAVRVGSSGEPGAGPVADLQDEAARLAGDAAEVLGLALSGLGRHTEAWDHLQRALGDRPRDETLLAAVLRSEADGHGAPAALRRYEAHRTALRDELGTDPGPELRRVHAELLGLDRPVREGLQHEASRLIGRDDDVAALEAMLRTTRITSILGPGGLGKTRLAHLLGRRARQSSVHLVELAGVTSPDGVAVEVGSVLGVRDSVASRRLQGPTDRGDLLTRILERLGDGPALLVLDNCEHVVEAVADLVTALVARTDRLRVLTTTRAPLGLSGERVYQLPPLGQQHAVELFCERATSARPGARLDPEQVAALVERLDGLPLAVELAAAKVRVMSVEEISRRLADRFALLRGGGREAPERHRTLLAVIDWSWNLLAESERVALRRLSAFGDGFSMAGAGAVLGTDDPVAPLTALVDQSLVSVHETPGASQGVRFRLLETVREFGRVQLVAADDDRCADERLRAWAVAFATDVHARLFSPGQVQAMADLRVEEGNLTDVLRRAAADGDRTAVVEVMAALAGFWSVQGNHLKVVGVAELVEDAVADAELPDAVGDQLREVLVALVVNTMIVDGAPAARALARLRALGPGRGPGRVHAQTRTILAVSDAASFADAAVLRPLVEDPDPEVARQALMWTSLMRENAGDVEGALEGARAALALCRDDEGPWTRALMTSQLAGLAVQSGDPAAARSYAEDALGVMEALGSLDDTLQLKALLSFLEMGEGRWDAAAELLHQIDTQEDDRSVFGGSMVVLCGRAELALARGRTEEGLRLYVQAATSLRPRPAPVADPGPGSTAGAVTPWLLYPQAGSLAAHVRVGRHEAVRGARDRLRAEVLALLRSGPAFLDYPITGAVVLALAVWELTERGRSPADRERGARLLVVADLFAYNRLLPSLSWAWAEEQAELAGPGALAQAREELGGRRAPQLLDEVTRLLAELG